MTNTSSTIELINNIYRSSEMNPELLHFLLGLLTLYSEVEMEEDFRHRVNSGIHLPTNFNKLKT